MAKPYVRRGPWAHRILIALSTVVLTILLVWLLRFFDRDIGDIPGPAYEEVERQFIDPATLAKERALQAELDSLQARVREQREQQDLLRQSTDNSRQTMDQLLALHTLSLEKGVTPPAMEQDALAESKAQFLANQRRFQEANQELETLAASQRDIEAQLASLNRDLEGKRQEAKNQYAVLRDRHAMKTAALRLAVAVPILFAAAWLLLRKRGTSYAPLIWAVFIAAFLNTGRILYDCFPRAYFKYVAIGAAILIVLTLLIHLIRMIAAPRKDWLLKQYKEAYNRRVCPVCAFPFQGARARPVLPRLRRRAILMPAENTEDEGKPYTCPSCGEALFAACARCGKVRHALLPFCEHCGVEKEVAGTSAG